MLTDRGAASPTVTVYHTKRSKKPVVVQSPRLRVSAGLQLYWNHRDVDSKASEGMDLLTRVRLSGKQSRLSSSLPLYTRSRGV